MSQSSSKLLRKLLPLCLMTAALLAIAACGSSGSSSSSGSGSSSSSSSSGGSSSSGSSSGSSTHVALAQVVPANDHSFGQATHEGAVEAQQKLGIKLDEVDSLTTPAAQLTAVKDLARANSLVLYSAAMSVQSLASKFPNTQFLAQDGVMQGGANAHSQVQDWLPVTYLAGVAAAKESKTHVIGFIGGIPIPVILQGNQGYAAGAKSVDPSIKVLSTNIGSFTDSVKGKSAAQAQIASGADVIYADLDTAHQGIVEAAKGSGKDVHVEGSIAPKCDISKGIDLGDTVFDQTRITFDTIKTYVQNHSLPKTLTFGLKGGYSLFKLCPGASPAIQKAVATTSAGLLSGNIKP